MKKDVLINNFVNFESEFVVQVCKFSTAFCRL